MHGMIKKMNLKPSELPDFTTVCARKQQLKMSVWRVLLRLSTDLHDTGEVQAIDATGFDRHSASHHYANRTDYIFKSVKTTALVDCETSIVLDITVRRGSRTIPTSGGRYSHEILSTYRLLPLTRGMTGTIYVKNFGRLTSDQ